MRLSETEQQTIKESVSAFDKQAKVVLFGSRTMTDLRNEIAHDYIKSELVGTFGNILNQTPQVIALATRIKDYTERYVNTND